MLSDSTPINDRTLRDMILAGLSASAELDARFRQPLERFLVGKCGRSEGRSLEQAVEIANEVLADCFRRSPSLLERWHGEDNLGAFLRTTAHNRLKSWWRSADGRAMDPEADTSADLPAPATELPSEADELAKAATALRQGVKAAAEQCPDGLVFMRLKGLHGVDQRRIADCWGHHEAQTSRRIKEAMTINRRTAAAWAAAGGRDLSMGLPQTTLHPETALLFSSHPGPRPLEDEAMLQLVAAGGADGKTRAEAVARMRGDAASLGFFAELLNRSDGAETVVVRDPALTGVGARLHECVRRTVALLQPGDAAGLFTPLMAACFTDMLAHVGADGGTLWLLSPGGEALEAVYNPREPEIVGRRQPLVSGIISLVLATGEPALASTAAAHASHSPAIDMALGKTTRSMIAAPFTIAGATRGVVTAVRLAVAAPFSAQDAATVSHHAEVLSQLILATVRDRVLA